MDLTCQLLKGMREQTTFAKRHFGLSLRLAARSDSRKEFWTKLENLDNAFFGTK